MDKALRTPALAGSEGAHKNLSTVFLFHSNPFACRRRFLPPILFCTQASAATSSNKSSSLVSLNSIAAGKTLSSVAPHFQKDGKFQPNTITLAAIGATLVGVVVLTVILRPSNRAGGSVEDLVKRGQLRSDRKSNARPLKYEDPFNNPIVKGGENNTVVKMYGKAFKLQPVTLTDEKMRSHQNRRVQAYQWKRPTVFLVEGERIPDGVDPDTVRWIPPNHPFATTRNDFDEAAAEKNVYQTRGVPSRVRAEHEALRRRMMEAEEKETEMQVPAFDFGGKGEKKRFERTFPANMEQPDSGLGLARPIKPFENPEGEGLGKN